VKKLEQQNRLLSFDTRLFCWTDTRPEKPQMGRCMFTEAVTSGKMAPSASHAK